MKYRTFGKTGLQVSALAFGCMRLPVIGGDMTHIDEEKALEMIRLAIDHGVNYLDTAYPYHSDSLTSPGFSEPFLAKALKNGYREKVYVATKLPAWLVESRADMDKYLEEQLDRLETGYIDFYLLHSLSRKTWEKLVRNGVFDFMDKAVSSGKIRYPGFSFHDDIDLFKEIVDAYDWDFCQIMYNYFDEHFQAGREGLRYAADRNLGVVVMEPLRGGGLVDGLPEDARKILRETIPGRLEVDWAFRWLWAQPEVSVLLSGMSTLEQVQENLELAAHSSEVEWTPVEERAIEQVNHHINRLQKVNCTSCNYCMPCPEGIDIPLNFMLCNDHYMLNDPSARFRYYRLLGEPARASSCIGCGECLEKCPQQIAIPEEMEHIAGLFS